MLKYKVILNPTANRGAVGTMFSAVEEELKKCQLNFDLVKTEYPWHAAELTQQAIAEGYDVVVSAGGDGTANEIINGFMLSQAARPAGSAQPKALMGILTVGRGNDFAYGMGIPTSLAESAQLLKDAKYRPIDIGLIKGGLYPEGRYFGNGVGIGFDAVVGFVAAKNPHLRGFMSYLWAAVKTISLYFNAPLVKIELDNETITQRTLMLSAMNGSRMGGTFMMAPGNSFDDGLLTMGIFNQMSRLKMVMMIPRVMKGSQYLDKDAYQKQSRTLKVTALKGKLPVHADGETICTEGDGIQVELLPRQINLITKKV